MLMSVGELKNLLEMEKMLMRMREILMSMRELKNLLEMEKMLMRMREILIASWR